MPAERAEERRAVACSRLDVAVVNCTSSSTDLLWTDPAGGAGASAERAIILHVVCIPELSADVGANVCEPLESVFGSNPSLVNEDDDDTNANASVIAIRAEADR
jgi:hypothetical protein